MLVVEKAVADAEKELLGFETLTFAPIERRLVIRDMLSPAELDWLNTYHAQVLAKIGPKLEGDDRAWLESVSPEDLVSMEAANTYVTFSGASCRTSPGQ